MKARHVALATLLAATPATALAEPVFIGTGGPLIGLGVYGPAEGQGDPGLNFVLGLAGGMELASSTNVGYLFLARSEATYTFGKERRGTDWATYLMGGLKLSVIAPVVGIDIGVSKRRYYGEEFPGAWTIGVPFGLTMDLKYVFLEYIYAPQWFIANKGDRPSADWSTIKFPGVGDETRTFGRIGVDAVLMSVWLGWEANNAAFGTQGTFYLGIGIGHRKSWSSLAQ